MKTGEPVASARQRTLTLLIVPSGQRPPGENDGGAEKEARCVHAVRRSPSVRVLNRTIQESKDARSVDRLLLPMQETER